MILAEQRAKSKRVKDEATESGCFPRKIHFALASEEDLEFVFS